ncbi:MAG: GNAT family N-acetyltransferase [Thermoplasmata archaeon]|nr:GNAT family N-acetyltransferase [Thermoplasmata archaeon]
MKIIDLDEKNEKLYFVCLEDWSDQMKEAGDHKERWFGKMKDKGLRVKLALNDEGQVGGMIEYMPIEDSNAEGEDLYFVNCIWVHGYKEGRGNFQKMGMGKALIKAAEEDARSLGVKGIAAWGISEPVWINASWFKKQGFEKVDSDRGSVLLWKPFSKDALPPRWIKTNWTPELISGKVTVTSLFDGQCPAGSIVHERAKRAAEEFGDSVAFRVLDTSTKEAMRKYGERSALYIDGKNVYAGPPPSYDELRELMAKRIKKL